MALGGSVVLIILDRLCGADDPRLGHMALGGSVVLITLDRLCGADLPRLAIWPWAALWC